MNVAPVDIALSAYQQIPPTATVSSQFSLAMLDKAMETSEAANAGLVKMMEQSVNPNLGANFDVSV